MGMDGGGAMRVLGRICTLLLLPLALMSCRSLGASYDGGSVTTTPLQIGGGELRVNAKSDFGSLWAEVLDQRNQPIAGFTHDECQPMRADSVDHAILWKGNASLKKLGDRPVKFRFRLKNARMYSFRVHS